MPIFRRRSVLEKAAERALADAGDNPVRVHRETRTDKFVIRAGKDGVAHEACWFCGEKLDVDLRDPKGEAAAIMIEPFGHGEAVHGICHRSCADRAKGSLAI